MLRMFPSIWLSLGAICIIFLRKQLSSAVNAQFKKTQHAYRVFLGSHEFGTEMIFLAFFSISEAQNMCEMYTPHI